MNHCISILIRVIVVSVLAVGFAAPNGLAQEASGIAVVSLGQLQANFGELRAREQNLGHWLEERRNQYNELANYVFLSQKDFEETLAILQKPRPLSEENRERLQQLRLVSDERDARFSALRAKADRTPQEAAEFNTLQETYDARVETLQGLQQQIMQELSERRDTALSGLMQRVQDAITETAEALGYQMVLDADAVFFGGEDITEAVLERLNFGSEGPPAAPEREAPAAEETTEEPAAEETTEEPATEETTEEPAVD